MIDEAVAKVLAAKLSQSKKKRDVDVSSDTGSDSLTEKPSSSQGKFITREGLGAILLHIRDK